MKTSPLFPQPSFISVFLLQLLSFSHCRFVLILNCIGYVDGPEIDVNIPYVTCTVILQFVQVTDFQSYNYVIIIIFSIIINVIAFAYFRLHRVRDDVPG